MNAPIIQNRFHHPNPLAEINRGILRDANILAVSIVGGPGCGKTSLIDATIRHLAPSCHVGVIACDISSGRDAERMTKHCEQVVQVNVGDAGVLDASYIHDALAWLDLSSIDLLLIEDLSTLAGKPPDVGQDATVAVFSVAAGHDKPGKHPDLTSAVDAIVLHKTDLLPVVPFDVEAFRADVHKLNGSAKTFEMSSLSDVGFEPWVKWLSEPRKPVGQQASRWFG